MWGNQPSLGGIPYFSSESINILEVHNKGRYNDMVQNNKYMTAPKDKQNMAVYLDLKTIKNQEGVGR